LVYSIGTRRSSGKTVAQRVAARGDQRDMARGNRNGIKPGGEILDLMWELSRRRQNSTAFRQGATRGCRGAGGPAGDILPKAICGLVVARFGRA